MSYIHQVSEAEAEATGQAAELFESNRGTDGTPPNFVRASSHRPEIYAAWRALLGAIRTQMDALRYELTTLAAAKALASSYCSLAHGSVLLNGTIGEAQLRAIATDHRAAGLSEVEIAVMDLAEAVACDASTVRSDQIDRLRTPGLDEGEICDVIAAAAARCFFSKYVDATGTEADSKYATLPKRLLEVLTIGRPIAEA